MCTISYFLIGYSTLVQIYVGYIVMMVIFSVNTSLFCLVIGCLIDDISTATLVASISMLFQMLFAGILVNQVNIPASLRWVQYLSFFKYAYEAVSANDSADVRIVAKINGIDVSLSAATILAGFGIDVTAYSKDITISICITMVLTGIVALLVTYKFREKR